ncbi:MAG: hemerythrin domain-containing protein [Thermomonas sp.]
MARKEQPALESAIEMLSKQHDEVDDMFGDYKKLMDLEAAASKRKALASKICKALTEHAALEETIFYPAARKALDKDAEDIMDHSDVEHATLKGLIERITNSPADDPHFDALVHVMAEYVKHHVEEEEGEMFSELRKAEAKMDDVLKQMKAFKPKG